MKEKHTIPVLYEDDHLIVINKPPRMATLPGGKIKLRESALWKIQEQFADKNIKPYALHRLDRETSGVLLFGKFPRDRAALEGIFAQPDTRKKYLALVNGIPRGGLITIKLESRAGKERIPAETRFRIITVFKKPAPLCSFVEAEIKTGRKHQIRQHFSMIKSPVILDSRYGDFRFNRKFRIIFRLGRQFLHAASFEFMHPFLKKIVRIEAPLPQDLQNVLKKLSSVR